MPGLEYLITKFATQLVLPPGINIILGLAGLWWCRRRPRLGMTLLLAAVFSLYLLSTTLVSGWLIEGLEIYPAADPARLTSEADVIVVLGGGAYRDAPEYGGDTVSTATLARLRYAAYLYRRTGLPLMVTGGTGQSGLVEAELMAAVLQQELSVPVRWIERRSRNTHENAQMSAQVLSHAGLQRVAVVTHAWHMPRAVAAFRRQALTVVPAPIEFRTHLSLRWYRLLLPQSFALEASTSALYEYAGQLWYWLRY